MSDRLADFDVAVKQKKKPHEKEAKLSSFGFELPQERMLQFDREVRTEPREKPKEKGLPKVRPSEQLFRENAEL